MDGAPLFALIGPALMLVQITVPVFALAAKLPRRGLPRIVEGIVPIVLMLPVWLFLTSRWQYFAPTDVPGTLTTFFIILALLVAAVMIVHRASAWSALFCASAGYTIQNIASSTSTLNGNVADLIGMHEVYAEHILIYEQVVLVIVYALAFLLRLMEAHYGKKPVLLLDEYDVPIQSAWEHGYYDEAIDFFREFYSTALKTNPSLEYLSPYFKKSGSSIHLL